jgi:hypothetical protein
MTRCLAVSWLDYDHLFPRLSAVVHHGRMGTTHAAVLHGVPRVIVPHAADQGLHAQRAETNGARLTVTHDAGFRIRARNLSAAFAGLGGAPRAAEWVSGPAKHAD